MSERFKVIQAVFVAVVHQNQILLQLRQNTGFMNGYYDLPSGHVEQGETFLAAATRELKEETGLIVHQQDLRLFHINQNMLTPEKPFVYFFFKAINWQGQPTVGDAEKIADVAFFDMDNLPKTVPYVITALKDLNSKGVSFSYD